MRALHIYMYIYIYIYMYICIYIYMCVYNHLTEKNLSDLKYLLFTGDCNKKDFMFFVDQDLNFSTLITFQFPGKSFKQ